MFFGQLVIPFLSVVNRATSFLTGLHASFPSPDLTSSLISTCRLPRTHHCLHAYTHAVPSDCLLPSSPSTPILPALSTLSRLSFPMAFIWVTLPLWTPTTHVLHTFYVSPWKHCPWFYGICNPYVPDVFTHYKWIKPRDPILFNEGSRDLGKMTDWRGKVPQNV